MVDSKTKAVLDKISHDAPKLGTLLTKALRDGVISPDTALALSAAAHNINADVAEALWAASRSINVDVAEMLIVSSNSINMEVASTISRAAGDLERIPEGLRNIAAEMREITAEMHTAAQEIRELLGAVQAHGDFDSSISAILGASENLAMAASRVAPQPKPGRFLLGIFVGVLLVVVALGFYAHGGKVA
ncbi:hypothetical protein [Micromonospora sp. HUAS LYJ1]|uniref:hypothetical protein n=1 Tax=Micromonospora sp. HUAS LYJ1 TaxID=3061626 RepID=UPI0026727A9E|nr:hypothetical protein [Micromonospora sp. HUAS LYJ1]WKU07464.1 hypothetical protein Q2K16_10675 [Micromonospora sp. HUAS LYJ1]